MALTYPLIDPIAAEIGPLVIRWYSLAYVAGILLGWRYMLSMTTKAGQRISKQQIDDFVVWITLGIVLGGRIGYVLFYQTQYLWEDPLQALKIWEGGMSFHGGLLGVIAALVLFARIHKVPLLHLGDLVACAVPIGLFFGRIANFINGELFGRTSDVPWAMIFPRGGAVPRHPSQLYEAALEGIMLFFLLGWLARKTNMLGKPGRLGALFIMGYGLSRFIVEFFREPDAHLGVFIAQISMGQLLSLPMIGFGIGLYYVSTRKYP